MSYIWLDPQEYAKIVSEINTNYFVYAGKTFAMHKSVGLDGFYYIYYFENHGYNHYYFIDKRLY